MAGRRARPATLSSRHRSQAPRGGAAARGLGCPASTGQRRRRLDEMQAQRRGHAREGRKRPRAAESRAAPPPARAPRVALRLPEHTQQQRAAARRQRQSAAALRRCCCCCHAAFCQTPECRRCRPAAPRGVRRRRGKRPLGSRPGARRVPTHREVVRKRKGAAQHQVQPKDLGRAAEAHGLRRNSSACAAQAREHASPARLLAPHARRRRRRRPNNTARHAACRRAPREVLLLSAAAAAAGRTASLPPRLVSARRRWPIRHAAGLERHAACGLGRAARATARRRGALRTTAEEQAQRAAQAAYRSSEHPCPASHAPRCCWEVGISRQRVRFAHKQMHRSTIDL